MFNNTFIKGYFIVNNMHEAEVGSNSIEAMTRGGYWS